MPESEEQILAACEDALRLAPAVWPQTLPHSKELLGAPQWYRFEHDAWAIGESIRLTFVKNPGLKKKPRVLSKVLGVATCRNLRRGRQSFVMALGFVAARPHAEALAPFLTDPDVDGQVIHALLKMKAPGFARLVSPLIHSDKTWIRRLAKTYIDRFPDEPKIPRPD